MLRRSKKCLSTQTSKKNIDSVLDVKEECLDIKEEWDDDQINKNELPKTSDPENKSKKKYNKVIKNNMTLRGRNKSSKLNMSDIQADSEKLNNSKKRFVILRSKTNFTDKKNLKMCDLIFFNPDNLPKKSKVTHKLKPKTVMESIDDSSEEESKVNINTEITKNTKGENEKEKEKHLCKTVNKKKNYKNREDLDTAGRKITVDSKLDDEGNVLNKDNTIRSLYKRSGFVKSWNVAETQKFYKALSVFGTDFSLMRLVFTTRTIEELKSKYKKEDKINRSLVEKALNKEYIAEEFEDVIADSIKAKVLKTNGTSLSNKTRRKHLKEGIKKDINPEDDKVKNLSEIWSDLNKKDTISDPQVQFENVTVKQEYEEEDSKEMSNCDELEVSDTSSTKKECTVNTKVSTTRNISNSEFIIKIETDENCSNDIIIENDNKSKDPLDLTDMNNSKDVHVNSASDSQLASE